MNNRTDDDIVRRARARAALQHRDPRRPAFIEIQFVGCVGDGHSRSLPNYDFTSAEIYEDIPDEPVKSFVRGEGETLDAFRARVFGELPAVSQYPPAAIFYSPDIPSIPKAVQ